MVRPLRPESQATVTGFEPVTSALTRRRSNRLNYTANASLRTHSPPGGCALSNPPPRGAVAFGVRVRSIGVFDEPHRGRAGIEPASG